MAERGPWGFRRWLVFGGGLALPAVFEWQESGKDGAFGVGEFFVAAVVAEHRNFKFQTPKFREYSKFNIQASNPGAGGGQRIWGDG